MSRPPRLLDSATTAANHERFVKRAVANEKVWTLYGESNPVVIDSNDDEEDDCEPRMVLIFFSDEAYAKRALKETWPDEPDFKTRAISLFDFLFRWLTGLEKDGHLVGTNWTGDLIGVEVEPSALKDQILDSMPETMVGRYVERLRSGLDQQ